MREFGSEHPAILLPDEYFDSFKELGNTIYLRSGREALLYVATLTKLAGTRPVILFPAYCCWSMSAPFEKAGWKIVYYRLNEDLTVDIDFLIGLMRKCHPYAVLTMNYYGSASTNSAVKAIKAQDQKCLVVEDFSHCTFSIKQIFNQSVDYYVSSIRKSIGICDGAVVISQFPLDESIIGKEETALSDLRYHSQILKGEYAFSKNENDKKLFLREIREGEGILNDFEMILPMTGRAQRMLKTINSKSIVYARRENFKHLYEVLKDKIRMPKGIERAFDGAPFSLPILMDNRDELQSVLAQKGLYAPVLWPLCDEARRVCPVSAQMSDKMLSIPIDQRYDYDDMEDIAQIITDTI